MVALFACDPIKHEWILVDVKPKMCHLFLKSQLLERQSVRTMFQTGIYDELEKVLDDELS